MEQYAPVSSARDRFNKADDKTLTPRNSYGYVSHLTLQPK